MSTSAERNSQGHCTTQSLISIMRSNLLSLEVEEQIHRTVPSHSHNHGDETPLSQFCSVWISQWSYLHFFSTQQMNCCRHCNFSWQNLLNFGILTHTNHEGEAVTVMQILPSMMILPSWIPATHDAFVHCLHTNIIASYEYSLGQNCTATRPGHSIWHVVYGVHAC